MDPLESRLRTTCRNIAVRRRVPKPFSELSLNRLQSIPELDELELPELDQWV